MNNSNIQHIQFKDTMICDCTCHVKGTYIMHCFPCCDFCGVHYINEDGSLDVELFQKLNDKKD